MYKVVLVELDEYGTDCRKTYFRSALVDECWAYINAGKAHPSKLVRDTAEKLFVFDDADKMVLAKEFA